MIATDSMKTAMSKYYVSNKSNISEYKRMSNYNIRVSRWLNEWSFSFGSHVSNDKPRKVRSDSKKHDKKCPYCLK